MKAPSVIVSSTFYDLRQIRSDLTDFIASDLGFIPLLSELDSFPIDPDSDTISNCKRRVENDADIMVLIIGGRYGYVDSNSAKSITNLEYLIARAKNIPVYVFVQKNLLALLPIWRNNKKGDFSSTVDSARIFEFIESLRDVDKVWIFEFETAQNIIKTLKSQFSYLMYEGLFLRAKLKDKKLPKDPNLSGESIRLFLERPKAWEYLLLSQSLIDQINSSEDSRREYEFGLVLGEREQVTDDNFASWFHLRLEELTLIMKTLSKLTSSAIKQSLGPPGQPGNADEIIFVTRKLADIYKEAIEWSNRVMRASFEEHLLPIQGKLADFSKSIIDQIGVLGPNIRKQVEEALALPETGETRIIEVNIVLTIPNQDQFIKTFQDVTKEIINRKRNGTA